MKKILLSLALLSGITAFAQPGNPTPNPRKVQVSILFDTSNSMDGLIDQAKSRIWNIVNEVSSLTYNGVAPDIEFALYQYGNDNLKPNENYIEQVLGLTSDLDLLSEKLFGLRTNGGSEFCGAVIGRSIDDLAWSDQPTDLKIIYIAGNEPFNQGPIKYEIKCKEATEKGIFINTIYCGPYDQGIQEGWKDGATCSSGDFFNIDSDKKVIQIDTPYDSAIDQYNDSLNQTYIGIGRLGVEKKQAQMAQDANAEGQSMMVKTERAIVKSKGGAYKNSSWDLVDAVDEGRAIEDIEEEELPEEFRNKTAEEKEELVKDLKDKRARYQSEISRLAVERQAFVDEEMKKRAAETGETEDDFGKAVNESIYSKAKEIGYEKVAPEQP